MLALFFVALLSAAFLFLACEVSQPLKGHKVADSERTEYIHAMRAWCAQSKQEENDWIALLSEAQESARQAPVIGSGPAHIKVVADSGHEWVVCARTVQGAHARARAAFAHLGCIVRSDRGYYNLVSRETTSFRLTTAISVYQDAPTPLSRIALISALQDYARSLYSSKDAQTEFISSWMMWA